MKHLFSLLLFFISTSLFAATPSQKQINVENALKAVIEDPSSKKNILERMKFYNVSATSIAVVNDNRIEWAEGYGHVESDPNSQQITPHTLFQAGSVSKPITALGALLLVQQGKISLDTDVNQYLKRWKIPDNQYTNLQKITLRQLLSHTAGTSIDGFPGYAINSQIPNIVDILQGKKPIVNTAPVIVERQPGSSLKYSGGGTLIVQLLIEDITNEPFDLWMQKNILIPLGMCESSFEQPLPSYKALRAASGYNKGKLIENKWKVYPELSAAGLWSTPRDLAKVMIFLQSALNEQTTSILNSSIIKDMLTRQKIDGKETMSGLGLFLENNGKDLAFMHDGQNEGFITRFFGYGYVGKGVVIMINNDDAWPLMKEITYSVAENYSWPNVETNK